MLRLPKLEIRLSDDSSECDGVIGKFRPQHNPWRISICNDKVTTVYLHELAHAWIHANLDHEVRVAFTNLRGLPTWSDPSFDWGERASEVAANVIALGLEDPGKLESGIEKRILGFELLTGIEAPRLGPVGPPHWN